MIILDQVYLWDTSGQPIRQTCTEQIANEQRLFDLLQCFMNTDLHGKDSGIKTLTVDIRIDGLNYTKKAIVHLSNAEYNRIVHEGYDIQKYIIEFAENTYRLYYHECLHGYYYITDSNM
jgi:hypothetical protein